MKMHTIVVSIFVACLLLAGVMMLAMPANAGKPADNNAGAVNVPWHLSADVMPVPPFGSQDIIGSDTSSKLMVNQPNGQVQLQLTGVMGGLLPSTEYTVYISNGYVPYVYTGWDVTGSWNLKFTVTSDGSYDHDVFITSQAGGVITGTAAYPAGGPYTIIEGLSGTIATLAGTVTLHLTQAGGYFADATGIIASDGTMSGSWIDSNSVGGTWSTNSGQAIETHTGSTGWPGLSTNVQPFTFTSNPAGQGSWHVNLRMADFIKTGPIVMSVWINSPGGTMLISDNFTIVV